MTAAEYRAALAALGLSTRGARHVLGISERTSFAYAQGETPVRASVAKLLAALLAARQPD